MKPRDTLLLRASRHDGVNAQAAMCALGLGRSQTYEALAQLVKDGKLFRVDLYRDTRWFSSQSSADVFRATAVREVRQVTWSA